MRGTDTSRLVTDTIMSMTKESKYSQQANQAEGKEPAPRIKVSSILKDIIKQKRKRNIGITISIRKNETSVWTNGNALFSFSYSET